MAKTKVTGVKPVIAPKKTLLVMDPNEIVKFWLGKHKFVMTRKQQYEFLETDEAKRLINESQAPEEIEIVWEENPATTLANRALGLTPKNEDDETNS